MAVDKRNLMTEEDYQKLLASYDVLVNVKRPEIIRAIEEARGQGDLSENAEYTAAREEQGKNEAEITRLEHEIKTAVVVRNISTERVGVGTTVRYINLTTGKTSEYAIVGSNQASPENGRFSLDAPIAAALNEHKLGDVVEAKTPRGMQQLQILDIQLSKPVKTEQ